MRVKPKASSVLVPRVVVVELLVELLELDEELKEEIE